MVVPLYATVGNGVVHGNSGTQSQQTVGVDRCFMPDGHTQEAMMTLHVPTPLYEDHVACAQGSEA